MHAISKKPANAGFFTIYLKTYSAFFQLLINALMTPANQNT